MAELKRCPFCGGEAILETVDGNSPKECYIYCPECDFESGVYSEPKFIVEKWNRRADNVSPVVRCKDCKHLVAVNVNGKGIPTCRVSGMEVATDEFCSRGEKGRR